MRGSRQNTVKSLVPFLFSFCASTILVRDYSIIPSDDDMIIGARAIVRGESLGSKAASMSSTAELHIHHRQVEKSLKGQILSVEIGSKNWRQGRRQDQCYVSGNPQLQESERNVSSTWIPGRMEAFALIRVPRQFNIVKDPGPVGNSRSKIRRRGIRPFREGQLHGQVRLAIN